MPVLARRCLRPITSKVATTTEDTEDTERDNLRGPGLAFRSPVRFLFQDQFTPSSSRFPSIPWFTPSRPFVLVFLSWLSPRITQFGFMRSLKRVLLVGFVVAGLAVFPTLMWAQSKGADKLKRRQEADALFTNGALHRLKIDILPAGMDSLRQNARANVTATLHEGATMYSNIQVHLKGGAGSFRPLDDKPGLTIKLGETGPLFHGLNKFHLNNAAQDDTYLSEWTCSQLFREAGVPAARVAHAVVELNGRRLGLFVIVESINADFLTYYSKNTQGNVYGQGPNADITEPLERMGGKDNTNWHDLKMLVAACQETKPEKLPERLSQVLDLNRFLSFMALETILDHWDGYTYNMKNYFVYHNLDTDKMIFIPHDLDQMMHSANRPILPHTESLAARAVLKVPEFRERYLNRLGEIATNIFVVPVLVQRIDEQSTRLASQLKDYDPELAQQVLNNSGNLKQRLQNRASDLARQLQNPDGGTLRFVQKQAQLVGWRMPEEPANAKLSQGPDTTSKKVLWIAATGPTTASWRLRVSLTAGHYVFEGRGRTAGVKSVPTDDRGVGAGLRISGSSRTAKLLGDNGWTPMSFEFEVNDTETEVELICELRATQGQAWFDEESLRLIRR
jgi:spore coat protein H